jgi:hypothetical protein
VGLLTRWPRRRSIASCARSGTPTSGTRRRPLCCAGTGGPRPAAAASGAARRVPCTKIARINHRGKRRRARRAETSPGERAGGRGAVPGRAGPQPRRRHGRGRRRWEREPHRDGHCSELAGWIRPACRRGVL